MLPGVLWLSVISEFMYIGLLAMGFLLMCVEALCLCAKREMNALKINAFAAMCTVLSGENKEHFLSPKRLWALACLLDLKTSRGKGLDTNGGNYFPSDGVWVRTSVIQEGLRVELGWMDGWQDCHVSVIPTIITSKI